MRRQSYLVVAIFAALAMLLFTNNAMAYVGPGAGMEFVGYAMSLMTWIGLALFSVMLYPIYSLRQWLRGKKNESPAAPAA